jgi:hypothetical protein
MALDRAGDELATRKDKLAFAQKIARQKDDMFQQEMKIKEDAFGHKKFSDITEFGLGLASTGINTYRRHLDKQRDIDFKRDMKRTQAMMYDFYGIRRDALPGESFDYSNYRDTTSYDIDY